MQPENLVITIEADTIPAQRAIEDLRVRLAELPMPEFPAELAELEARSIWPAIAIGSLVGSFLGAGIAVALLELLA